MIPIADPVAAALAVLLGGAQMAIALDDPDGGQKIIRKQDGESDFDFLARIARENGWEMARRPRAARRRLPAAVLLAGGPPHAGRDAQVGPRSDRLHAAHHQRRAGRGRDVPIWIPPSRRNSPCRSAGTGTGSRSTSSITPGFGMPASAGERRRRAVHVAGQAGDACRRAAHDSRRAAAAPEPPPHRHAAAPSAIRGCAPAACFAVEGVGEQFGGLYRVTSVTHTIDSGGWRTTFEARKEIWFGSIPLPEQGAVPVRVAV